MDTMLSKALREFTTGPLNQLIVNLGGDDGDRWDEEFKRFLRKEPCWNATQVVQTAEDPKIVIDWIAVYRTLGLEAELVKSGIQIDRVSNLWEVPVVQGVTMNKVVQALRELGVKVYLYTEDLDADVTDINHDSARDSSYLVKFKKNIEADEELANKSANDLESEKVDGITLRQRLLLELGYFLATNEHLDIDNVTLCSGSRSSDGGVPRVHWITGGREVSVDWYGPGYSDSRLRSRAVVS